MALRAPECERGDHFHTWVLRGAVGTYFGPLVASFWLLAQEGPKRPPRGQPGPLSMEKVRQSQAKSLFLVSLVFVVFYNGFWTFFENKVTHFYKNGQNA